MLYNMIHSRQYSLCHFYHCEQSVYHNISNTSLNKQSNLLQWTLIWSPIQKMPWDTYKLSASVMYLTIIVCQKKREREREREKEREKERECVCVWVCVHVCVCVCVWLCVYLCCFFAWYIFIFIWSTHQASIRQRPSFSFFFNGESSSFSLTPPRFVTVCCAVHSYWLRRCE